MRPPQALKLVGSFQEFNDLHQFFLRLVNPGHVGEGDFGLVLDIDLRLALSYGHHPTHGTAHPTKQKDPHP